MDKIKETAGRILSVDFGDTRTGLAISDETRFLASGIGYISPGGIVKTADEVARIAEEQSAAAIVVGHPINMDGSHGPRAERASEFARQSGQDISAVLRDWWKQDKRSFLAAQKREEERAKCSFDADDFFEAALNRPLWFNKEERSEEVS